MTYDVFITAATAASQSMHRWSLVNPLFSSYATKNLHELRQVNPAPPTWFDGRWRCTGVGVLLYDRTHLEANCDAEADQEDGDGQLVEDPERAEDVAEDLLQEELLSEHGQHAQHIQDIEDRNRCDERRHEGLKVVALPRKDHVHVGARCWPAAPGYT